MADRIGVARRWHQKPPKASSSHYDIALTKRALAVAAGAVEITWRQASMMTLARRTNPSCPLLTPAEIDRLIAERKERATLHTKGAEA
jgi:hypothetical protein